MAKKRRREEEAAFDPPDFDEVRYMRREVEGAKGAVIALLLAVAIAFVSFLMTQAGLGAVGLLLIILIPFTMKPIYRAVGINLELFDRRVWASMIFILIAAAVSIWIVFLNPPFVDHTPPTIKDVKVEVGGQTLTLTSNSATIKNATQATVIASIPDNDPVTATFTIIYGNNGTTQRITEQCSVSSAECPVVVTGQPGTEVTVRVSAVDSHGNATTQDTVITLTFS